MTVAIHLGGFPDSLERAALAGTGDSDQHYHTVLRLRQFLKRLRWDMVLVD